MLSFSPPYRVISGHPVFADHLDPHRFYILPAGPRLALGPDGLPDIALLRYLGEADLAGGFLSLRAALDIPQARRDAVAARLQADLGQPVTLTDALFDDGRVDLILLGDDFDLTVLGSGQPSLAGENTAAFQVQLDAMAAALIDAGLGRPALPALVVYRMGLTGLQPGFDVTVTGDWSALHTDLQTRFQANVYYVRADMEARVKTALTSAGIKVQTTVQDTGAAEAAAEAERRLMDWVTGTFFDPGYGAEPPPDPAVNIIDAIKTSALDLVSSLMPGAAFKLKALRDAEVRHFDARIDQTLARRRDLVFQGSLGAALQTLRVDDTGGERPTWPQTRARLVTEVNIAAIPRREVTLGVMDRFASDGLTAIEIELALPDTDDTASHIFHDAATREIWAVNLLGQPASTLTGPYRYRVTVHYDPASPFGTRQAETGPWLQGRAGTLIVDPRVDGAYHLRSPRIGLAPGFPFAQFPQVFVDLRAGDQQAALTLDAATPQQAWTFRGHDPAPDVFDCRVTYDRPFDAGGPITRDWQSAADLLLTLPDPAPHRRRVTFFLNLPWPDIALAFIETRYDDASHDLHIAERITLSADTPLIERDYAIADPEAAPLAYRLTAFLPARGMVQGDWRETRDTTVVIGRELFDQRSIRFRVLGLPIDLHGLSSLRLRAEALDDAGQVLSAKTVSLAPGEAPADPGTWTFPRQPPASLRQRAEWRDANGFPSETAWSEVKRDLIVFSLPRLGFVT